MVKFISLVCFCFAVQALLINSANLMGGSSDPNYSRGFGRIHMDAGMPLDGQGDLVLFVADAAKTNISEQSRQEYLFDVDGAAGLDLRATISWIDPAATTFSAKQLVHDLDLAVVSPNMTRYTMWTSGVTDEYNVNERVIVDAADVESGTWTILVWAKALGTDFQNYSLVVNGAISPATGEGAVSLDGKQSTSLSFEETSLSPSDPGIEGNSFTSSSTSSTSSEEEEEDTSKSVRTAVPVRGLPVVLAVLTCMLVAVNMG